jgi:hypothetical protein
MEVPVTQIIDKGPRRVYLTERRSIDIDEEHSTVTLAPTVDTHDEAYAKAIMMLLIDSKEMEKDGPKYVAHKDDDETIGFWITIRKRAEGTTVELKPAPAVPIEAKKF